MMATVGAVKAVGIHTAAGIAAELNRRGVRARRGGDWQATQVIRIFQRLQQPQGGH